MFEKILIANRGEIAVRVLRACKDLGIQTVAVYSTADKDAMHVRMADESVCIGPPQSKESYLNIPSIIAACEVSGADAVHPGYGFLSENASFVEKLDAHNIKFIGPKANHIKTMGDKILAKKTAEKYGLPVIPGSNGEVKNYNDAKIIAEEIGYPIIIKASAGGGGRGMVVVFSEEDLEISVKKAKSEADNSFDNDTIYIEKYLQNPKHIEVQIIGDNFGNMIHLGERDCSMQRRNQKIIEETQACGIAREEIDKIGAICSDACVKLGYTGAGTFEFLYKDEEFYFIEMNTKLQVEHTVSEMITDYDLVKLQIGIAAGEELEIKQEEISVRGHAIQCRINAEHPKTFIPSPGKITEWGKPGGIGVRVDSHVYDGCIISPYYDALIAKICTQGKDREEALCRMSFALEEFFVEGIDTNKELQEIILSEENFRKANISINYLEKVLDIN